MTTTSERVGTVEVVSTRRPGALSLTGRIALTSMGAGLAFAGAVTDWLPGLRGTDLAARVFYRTDLGGGSPFLASAGAAVILLAVLVLAGLATPSGWLTRLAGGLLLAAFGLFLVQAVLGDAVRRMVDLRVGIWLVLSAGAVGVIGGSVGSYATVIREREVVGTRAAVGSTRPGSRFAGVKSGESTRAAAGRRGPA